jgi:hypothetical protein
LTRKQLDEYRSVRREIAEEKARVAEIRGGKSKAIAREIDRKLVRLERQQADVERFIGSIDDSLVRRIVVARYIESRSWEGVARKLRGGNTSDGVRKIWQRWAGRNLR